MGLDSSSVGLDSSSVGLDSSSVGLDSGSVGPGKACEVAKKVESRKSSETGLKIYS